MQAVLETGFVPVAAIDNEITNEDPVLRELELGEISGQCKSVVNDLDTIETACEALEELSDLSDILSKNNAIGSDAASLAAISSESICRRLGYVREKPIMPSMESFSYSNSRKQATEYTLESLGSIASDVWEAVKKFFAKIVEGIKKVFKLIRDFIIKILRMLGFLKEQVHVIYKDKTKVYESERMVDFSPFCVSFNVPKAKELHDKVTNVLEDSLNVSKALIGINDALSTFYQVAITAKDIPGLILETEDSGFDVNKFKLKEVDKTSEYVTVGEFVNAKHIRFYKKGYKVEIVDGQRVTVNDGSMAISKKLDLPSMVSATEKLAKSIEDNAKREDRLKNLTSVMTKAADNIVKKAKNSEENKTAARMFKVMSSSAVNTTSSLLQLVTQNLTESLKYIEFCKRELIVNAKTSTTFQPKNNLKKTLETKGVDLMLARHALRFEIYDASNDTEYLLNAGRWAEAKVPDIFEPYKVSMFNEAISENKQDWSVGYYDLNTEYLSLNFSKERFLHVIKVRQYHRDKGSDGFFPNKRK